MLLWDWEFWARPEQLPPPGDWAIWALKTGRGWGKTRTAAQFVRAHIDRAPFWNIVGPTSGDVRDIMVEGESGLIAVFPPDQRPAYEPSKLRLTFHNGAVGNLFTAEEPDRLRGPQCAAWWADELQSWRYADETWQNLMLGWRLPGMARGVVTFTPRPTAIIRDLLARADHDVALTEGTSYENKANLNQQFFDTVIRPYENTRRGRQELMGELLEEVEGALWTRARVDATRVAAVDLPALSRVVVGIDPSGGVAETGIVAAGLGVDGHLYILEDASCRAGPSSWAAAACALYERHNADRIVAEKNFGGDMVASTIRSVPEGRNVAYRDVTAARGKQIRAEPIAAFYEQGRAHNVGVLAALEDEMTGWAQGDPHSPNRLDAMVWAATELIAGSGSVWGAI